MTCTLMSSENMNFDKYKTAREMTGQMPNINFFGNLRK